MRDQHNVRLDHKYSAEVNGYFSISSKPNKITTITTIPRFPWANYWANEKAAATCTLQPLDFLAPPLGLEPRTP